MRIRAVIIALLVIAVSAAGVLVSYAGEAPSPAAKTLKIKDAVDFAFLNNKSVQIQKEEIEYAKANIQSAQSAFFPHVDTELGYTFKDAVPPTYALLGGRKDQRSFTGYQNDNLFTLGVKQIVYNGGTNIGTLEQARLNLKVEQETLRATKLEVEFETKRLFYGVLLAYETLRIAQDLVDQARAHYEEVRKKFDQGTASRFDALQSKTHVARLIPQLVRAESSVELLTAEFKKLLSIDLKNEVSLVGELKTPYIEIKEDDFLQETYRRNPYMILRLLGLDINKVAIDLAKAAWYPQINASANLVGQSNSLGNILNSFHNNWDVGIRGSMDVFDGFATKAKVDEAKAKYNQAELHKENTAEQLAVDIKDACLNLVKAKAVIESQEAAIVEAKEALRLSEVRYDNGVGINLDVFDAEVALAQVEQQFAEGVYDYIMANAQLDRTMGKEVS